MDILFIYPAESEGLLRNPKVCRWHPCNQNKRPACSSKLGQTGLMFCLRKVRDSNPRYDVMRTPHFECGSFDHSDNFPFAFGNAFASDADERHKSDACLRSPPPKRCYASFVGDPL